MRIALLTALVHNAVSDILVVELALQLFDFLDLAARLHKVLLEDEVTLRTDREHTSLSTNISHVGTIEVLADLGARLVVDRAALRDVLSVNLEDVEATRLVRQRNLNLTVKTTGTEQRGVESVGPICRHNGLDLSKVIETIELVEQLHERTLNFTIGRGTVVKSLAADSVDLIDENDARLIFLSVREHFTDDTGTLTNVLVDDGRGDNLEEFRINLVGEGTSTSKIGVVIKAHAIRPRSADESVPAIETSNEASRSKVSSIKS